MKFAGGLASSSFHAAQGFMASRRRRSASAVSLITTIFMIAVMMVSVAWLGPLSRVPQFFHSFPLVLLFFKMVFYLRASDAISRFLRVCLLFSVFFFLADQIVSLFYEFKSS